MHLRSTLFGLVFLTAFALPAQDRWQQRVDHVIDVRLDDRQHMLRGESTFTYLNNGPAALDTLWVHLWPNAYRDRTSALCKQLLRMDDRKLYFADEADRGWIDSLSFSADGNALAWGYHPLHADIAWVALPEALGTGKRISVHTPFKVKIPDGRFSRLGHTGQAYYITQWFPKPAVHDENGWHAMPYLTLGEFHSEFGSYDVRITLPENYVVGATGVLQDAEEQERLDRMASGEHTYPEPALDPRTGRPLKDDFPPSSTRMKTLRYVQDDVHDFAWFADKRFRVEKSSVRVDGRSEAITTWALYTPRNAALWQDSAVQYVGRAVKAYSEWVGPYPYAACTAVDGTISAGGGMEYPMITIIGNMDSPMSLDNVIAHEVGHNWFYGILASNERDHAWMDEGVNSSVELRYMRRYYPNSGMEALGIPFLQGMTEGWPDKHRAFNELGYRFNARRNLDQAPHRAADEFTPLNYGSMVYMKTALAMDQLMAFLGKETFDRCMHAYFEEWRFRHPGPEDMRKVFERESGQDLGWCFHGLIGTDRKVDVKATGLKDGFATFRVKGIPDMPFPVTTYTEDGTTRTTWTLPTEGKVRLAVAPAGVDRLRADAVQRTLDIDRRNNTLRTSGLLRTWATPSVRTFTGIEQDDRRTIYWTPAVAYNAHDGTMLGSAFTNVHFPSQRLEWALAPLYGTSSERLAGGGRITWHMDRCQGPMLENLHIGVAANTASLKGTADIDRWYTRIVPSMRFDIRNDRGKRTTAHFIQLRSVVLRHTLDGTLDDANVHLEQEDVYHEIGYSFSKRSGLSPVVGDLRVLQHPAFTRFQLEATQTLIYNAAGRRVVLRGFFGQFLRKDPALLTRPMAWRLHWGSSDLLYDHLFVDRQDVGSLHAQQIAKYQGGFKTPNSQGTSDSWLAAVNMELDMPFALPLSIFGGYGLAPVTQVTQEGRTESTRSHWELGIGLRGIRDILEVWIPLAYSTEIADQLEFGGLEFLERIRFVVALEKLDPTTALRRVRN